MNHCIYRLFLIFALLPTASRATLPAVQPPKPCSVKSQLMASGLGSLSGLTCFIFEHYVASEVDTLTRLLLSWLCVNAIFNTALNRFVLSEYAITPEVYDHLEENAKQGLIQAIRDFRRDNNIELYPPGDWNGGGSYENGVWTYTPDSYKHTNHDSGKVITASSLNDLCIKVLQDMPLYGLNSINANITIEYLPASQNPNWTLWGIKHKELVKMRDKACEQIDIYTQPEAQLSSIYSYSSWITYVGCYLYSWYAANAAAQVATEKRKNMLLKWLEKNPFPSDEQAEEDTTPATKIDQ